MGPAGAAIGAVAGGIAGAAASGAAVNAVDRVDDDDTVSGIRRGNTADNYDNDTVTGTRMDDEVGDYDTDTGVYNDTNVGGAGHIRRDGIQTGGRDYDGTPDTRGISEKVADAVTGDRIDDKTGKPVM